MRLVLVGAVESTAVVLRALLAGGVVPKLLITLPTEMASNHSDYVDLLPIAAGHGVDVRHDANVNSVASLAAVRACAPDLAMVVGWSRLCNREFRAIPRLGVIGYHPTLLPKMRGRAALGWTLLLNVRETGGSFFWIDEGVDSGPIIVQHRFALTGEEYLGDLLDKHLVALQGMTEQLVSCLRAGLIPRVAQDESQATYLAHRTPADGEIDWSKSAPDIVRLIRSVSKPYPGAFTRLNQKLVRVWRSEAVDLPNWHAQQGQIMVYRDGMPVVRCGNETSLMLTDYVIEVEGEVTDRRLSGQQRFGRTK